jgi:hypothetical protein
VTKILSKDKVGVQRPSLEDAHTAIVKATGCPHGQAAEALSWIQSFTDQARKSGNAQELTVEEQQSNEHRIFEQLFPQCSLMPQRNSAGDVVLRFLLELKSGESAIWHDAHDMRHACRIQIIRS